MVLPIESIPYLLQRRNNEKRASVIATQMPQDDTVYRTDRN